MFYRGAGGTLFFPKRLLDSELLSWLTYPERKHLPAYYHTVTVYSKQDSTFIRSEEKQRRGRVEEALQGTGRVGLGSAAELGCYPC